MPAFCTEIECIKQNANEPCTAWCLSMTFVHIECRTLSDVSTCNIHSSFMCGRTHAGNVRVGGRGGAQEEGVDERERCVEDDRARVVQTQWRDETVERHRRRN